MKRHMRLCLLALLLAAAFTAAQEDVEQPGDGQNVGDEIPDDAPTKDAEDDKTEDAVVAQSPFGMFNPLSTTTMFATSLPLLMRLATWGGGFPFPSIAGPLLGAQQEPAPAASKVVLVLAEDLDTAGAQQANVNGQPAHLRVPRQSGDLLQQLSQITQGLGQGNPLGQIGQLSQISQIGQLGQMDLSQTAQGLIGQANPQQLLQQISQQNIPSLLSQDATGPVLEQIRQAIPASLQQSGGGLLGQIGPQLGQISQLGQLDLSQFQPLQQIPQLSQLLGATVGQTSDGSTSMGVSVGQSGSNAADAADDAAAEGADAGADDAEAAQTPPLPPASPASPASTLVGSAFANIPNMQQFPSMLGQAFPGFRSALSGFVNPDNAGGMGAASEISEVRVKPDSFSSRAYGAEEEADEERREEKNCQAALQEILSSKTTPILWFSLPPRHHAHHTHWANKKPKPALDPKVEANLKAFEREVVAELRQLQEFDRQARVLRTLTGKDSASYRKGKPISELPVHKITVQDVERTVSDEYVAMLLRKDAAEKLKAKRSQGSSAATSPATASAPVKRQAASQTWTKRDIESMLAQARGICFTATENEKTLWTKCMDDAKQTEGPGFGQSQQQPQMMRQRAEDNSKATTEQRQWANDGKMQPQSPEQQQRQMMSDMMRQTMGAERQQGGQQLQWSVNEMMRQWAEDKSKATAAAMPPQQRQWAEQQKTTEDKSKDQKQRQWAEQQQQQQQQQQQPKQTVEQQQQQQRQWVEQQQQAKQQAMQQQFPQMRQWAEQQKKQDGQHRQPKAPEPTMAVRAMDDGAMLQAVDAQQQPMVGESAPQMAENAGKARHKGGDLFDELDFFSSKKGQRHGSRPATIINYYYTQGGSRYPTYGGYSAPAGGYAVSYGGGGGYGGGSSYGGGAGGYGGGGASYGGGAGGYGGSDGGGYGGGAGGYGGGGASYGGGAYGSNAYGSGGGSYRTATGDEEIQAMLREHSTMPKIIFDAGQLQQIPLHHLQPEPNQSGSQQREQQQGQRQQQKQQQQEQQHLIQAATLTQQQQTQPNIWTIEEPQPLISNPTTTTTTTTTPAPTTTTTTATTPTTTTPTKVQPNTITATFSKDMPKAQQGPTPAPLPAPSPSDTIRLAHSFKLNSLNDLGVVRVPKHKCPRIKRNASYGTLHPIDEQSLDELRKTYKQTLQEITLSPNEDPAEALVRYNAASIREALERANNEPVEVNGGDAGVDGHEVISVGAAHHHHHQHHPHQHHHHQHEHGEDAVSAYAASPLVATNFADAAALGGQHGSPFQYSYTNSADLSDGSSVKSFSSKPLAYELPALPTAALMPPKSALRTQLDADIPQPELVGLLEAIRKRLENCCAQCRHRIISGLRANVDTDQEQRLASQCSAAQQVCEELAGPKNGEDTGCATAASDAEFERWLDHMARKGYERRFLTKAHHKEYLKGGKLALTVDDESDASAGDDEATVVKVVVPEQKSKSKALKAPINDSHIKRALLISNAVPKNSPAFPRLSGGKAFGSGHEAMPHCNKEQVQAVNAALDFSEVNDEAAAVSATTLNPYAMRGKFLKKQSSNRSTIVAAKESSPSQAAKAPRKFTRAAPKMPASFKVSTSSKNKSGNAKSKTSSAANQRKIADMLDKLYELSVIADKPRSEKNDDDCDAVATTARTTRRLRRRRPSQTNHEEEDAPFEAAAAGGSRHYKK